MRTTDLYVAVPADRFTADARTGAGRVWTMVIDILTRRGARIEPVDPSARRRPRLRPRRRPDVWLTPETERPLDVREPVVGVVHGAAWPLEEAFFDYVPRTFAEPFIAATEAMLARTSLVIVPSEYARHGLSTGYGIGDRVFVVPHGVDADTFNPSRRGGTEIVATAFGRPLAYVLFVSIPTMPHKNLAALREAMGLLAARGFPHGLVIAGGPAGGESPEELAAVVAEIPGTTGRVAWLGHVRDDAQLAGLMAECSAFCLPSFFDSFPLDVLEAMACAAPVVVSDRGGLPALVGDAALVVEPTAESVAAGLERVLGDSDLETTLRAAGRARAETMTWEQTADGWLDVLLRAAERSRGRRRSRPSRRRAAPPA